MGKDGIRKVSPSFSGEELPVPTVSWQKEGPAVRIIDQTRLPNDLVFIDCREVGELWEAIKVLRVRGAPALGVAGAFGACLAAHTASGDAEELKAAVLKACDYLATSRPTAVNLFWALERMRKVARGYSGGAAGLREKLLSTARAVLDEDLEMSRAMGRAGAALLPDECGVLTHCNAGGLATGGYGTALAVIYAAAEEGKHLRVYADETRPLLQGARLTSWELARARVDVTVIADGMAGLVMRKGWVDCVITGADRIAANGDAANKIGTYSLATLARSHGIPFYIAAPSSTFDLSLASGDEIPIEERAPEELTHFRGARIVAEGAKVYNPAFDVTPAGLVTSFITEKGVLRPPFEESIAAAFGSR